MSPATVFLSSMATIFFFLWLYAKFKKQPDEDMKSTEVKPNDEYTSSEYMRSCRNIEEKPDFSEGYPKIVKCRRKGEEGQVLLIRYPGDKGEKIYGRRRDDYSSTY